MPIFSYFYALFLGKLAKNSLQRHALSCSEDTQTSKLRGNYLNAENMNEVESSFFDKNCFLKVFENWQSFMTIFHMNDQMYDNI